MTLKQKAQEQHRRFPSAFDINAVMKCRSLGDFDDAFIAPIYGYEDKFDYYRNNGCKRFLSSIRVPSIAINALDDPIVGSEGLPDQTEYGIESTIRLVYHPYGGHCGFICDRWTIFTSDSNGWLADELARALDSIRTSYIFLKT
jgi:predicted alpha/beta-fold hydrolase